MTRLAIVCLAALVLVPPNSPLLFGADPPAPATVDVVQGRVASVSKGSIMIVDARGETVEYPIAADCLVTIDGNPGTVDKIGIGTLAKITLAPMAGRSAAKAIAVRAAERCAATRPWPAIRPHRA